MFPNVSFTLQDDSKSRESASSKGHVLRVPKVRNPLKQMICCFTLDTTDPFNLGCISTHVWSRIGRGEKINSNPASFTHDRLVQHVEEINATSGDLKLEGFMSLVGAPSKVRTSVWTTPCDSRHNDRLINICVSMK
jgi:DNA mismatch repair protein MLH3